MKKFLRILGIIITLAGIYYLCFFVQFSFLGYDIERTEPRTFVGYIQFQINHYQWWVPKYPEWRVQIDWDRQKTTVIPETGIIVTGIDLSNCVSYFDGCNHCSVKDGKADACTMMYCATPSQPKCLQYATGVVWPDSINTFFQNEVWFMFSWAMFLHIVPGNFDTATLQNSKNWTFEVDVNSQSLSSLRKDMSYKLYWTLISVSKESEKEQLTQQFGGIGYYIVSQNQYADLMKNWCTNNVTDFSFLNSIDLCGTKTMWATKIIYGLVPNQPFESYPNVGIRIFIIKNTNEVIVLENSYMPTSFQPTINDAIKINPNLSEGYGTGLQELTDKLNTLVAKEIKNPSAETKWVFSDLTKIVNAISIK